MLINSYTKKQGGENVKMTGQQIKTNSITVTVVKPPNACSLGYDAVLTLSGKKYAMQFGGGNTTASNCMQFKGIPAGSGDQIEICAGKDAGETLSLAQYNGYNVETISCNNGTNNIDYPIILTPDGRYWISIAVGNVPSFISIKEL